MNSCDVTDQISTRAPLPGFAGLKWPRLLDMASIKPSCLFSVNPRGPLSTSVLSPAVSLTLGALCIMQRSKQRRL